MKDFSIMIPTYNRREKLIRELQTLFAQKETDEVQIVILDNHSNYNVKEALTEAFPEKNIEVITYLCNVGGAMNICMPFFYCKTKWLWILSDDDVIYEDALQTIFKDIKEHPEVGIFKYSFDGYINSHNPDNFYYTLEDLAGLTGKKSPEGLMLCANAVYNMEVLEPFRGDIVRFSYNNIGSYLPVCYMLDAKAGVLYSREKAILRYMESDPRTAWNAFDLYLQSGTFFDYPFKASGEILKRIGGDLIPFRDFMSKLEDRRLYKDKIKCQLAFDKVYPYYLKTRGIRKLSYRLIFKIYKYTGINCVKSK